MAKAEDHTTGAEVVKVYLGRAVSGELGPRSLEAIQLAHRALREFGAGVLAERVADPDYRPGLDRPELIAEMIVHYATLVGRENVMVGNDCGFSSQAVYQPEVHPTVAWAKFQALAEGARLASRKLWPG